MVPVMLTSRRPREIGAIGNWREEGIVCCIFRIVVLKAPIEFVKEIRNSRVHYPVGAGWVGGVSSVKALQYDVRYPPSPPGPSLSPRWGEGSPGVQGTKRTEPTWQFLP